MSFDYLINKSNLKVVMASGGKRKNAGRKFGAQSKKTLEQKAVSDAFNQRVMISADRLFNAQLTLAVGSIKVFRVDEIEDGEKTKRVHTLVTDADEIKQVLDETTGIGQTTIDDSFYIVSEVLPDNKAIDSMLNRAFGKPKDSLDVTSNGKSIAPKTIELIDSPSQVKENAGG